jgi:uncharacterized protein DUF1488
MTAFTAKRRTAASARAKTASAPAPRLAAPRWDNNRVLFEVDDGEQHIECAIHRQALEEIGGRHLGRPLELLACFNKSRTRIERLALHKARVRGGSISGPVTIWSGDLETDANDAGDRTTSPPLPGG